MTEAEDTTSNNEAPSEAPITAQVKQAVVDAQFLVIHAARTAQEIDKETLEALIKARNAVTEKSWSTTTELEFWVAYNRISNEVGPVTVESAKSHYPSAEGTKSLSISWLLGRTRARRMVNIVTLFTVIVLAILLTFQVYWVIGNTLTTNLADLLQQEAELTAAINSEMKAFSLIELQFMLNESKTEGSQSDGPYAFYYTPEWNRETLETTTEREDLETGLETLKRRLDRNASILLVWSTPFALFTKPDDTGPAEFDQIEIQKNDIDDQISALEKKITEDQDGKKEVSAKRQQLDNLQAQLASLAPEGEGSEQTITQKAQLIEQIETLTSWLNTPDRAEQIVNQRQLNLADLKSQVAALERQLVRELTKEESRRAMVTGEFVLFILQSYFLPLLYGLLGASTFILRSLSKKIKEVTYSRESDFSYVLRLSLGALAGLIVGWFVFLLPGKTMLASVSPLAIAFLVGYNIEFLFSQMDRLSFSKPKPKQETTSQGSAEIRQNLAAGQVINTPAAESP